MSKEIFSEKISELMNNKMQALKNFNPNIIFSNEEYFELILCLSYMTLSKEKIIKKDMKNKSRLERLTRMVDEKDINHVFDSSFSNEMPRIFITKENDNTWILDNIRDSIMHGKFDIDEEKKCFIIDNQQPERKLNAEIPFSWFISYAKYDIFNKKMLDKCTIKGFFYNQHKKNSKNLDVNKEMINTILYKVDIDGTSVNVNEIEKRIKELFYKYSKEEIDENDIIKHKTKFVENQKQYNENYLLRFFKASELVKEQIEKEFPGTTVKIKIDNRKNKLLEKFKKRNQGHYTNYNLMYKTFNEFIGKKSNSLIQSVTNIIENIDKINKIDYSKLDILEQINLINFLLTGENTNYKKSGEIYTNYNNNMNILKSIYLNIYALSTLVINQENLYNSSFSSSVPFEYGLLAYANQPYINYSMKEKTLIMKLLEKEIRLFEKEEQLKKCTSEKGKNVLNNDISKIEKEIELLHISIGELAKNEKILPYIEEYNFDREQHQKNKEILSVYYQHFKNATKKEDKMKVRKVIGDILDKKIESESKYMFSHCSEMKDALTIIRNCFSHIGRVHIGLNMGKDTVIVLNDYDNNGNKTGCVIGTYENIINLLKYPFEKEKEKKLIK